MADQKWDHRQDPSEAGEIEKNRYRDYYYHALYSGRAAELGIVMGAFHCRSQAEDSPGAVCRLTTTRTNL
jgi:hypothetical protein